MLVAEFERRRQKKPSFSLRAFARYLGVPPTTLKFLLDGVRTPNGHTLDRIVAKCAWDAETVARIRHDLAERRRINRLSKKENFFFEHDPGVVTDIVVFALSRLAMFPNQKASVAALSEKLGVEPARVKSALEVLMSRDLIKVKDGVLESQGKAMLFAEPPPAKFVNGIHVQVLDHIRRHLLSADTHRGRTLTTFIGVDPGSDAKLDKLMNYMKPLRRDFQATENSELYYAFMSVVPFKPPKQG